MLTLPTALQTAINGQEIWTVKFIDLQIGDTTYYVSDHYKTLGFLGNDYIANGNFLSIDTINNSTTSTEGTVDLGLSGIDVAFRTDVLAADAIGGEVTIRRGFIDPDTGNLYATPNTVFKGIIYQISIQDGNPMDTNGSGFTPATFSIVAELRSTTFRLDERPGRATNNASNMKVDPTDISMEFVAGLNGRNLRFGA